jgi:outer membrane protein OmpA-like peptidoglycan-associated protein
MSPKLALIGIALACAIPSLPASAGPSPGVSPGAYLLGDVVEGRHVRAARLHRAGVAGIGPAEMGTYLDTQERALRAIAARDDQLQVLRQDDVLVVTIAPAALGPGARPAIGPRLRASLDALAPALAVQRAGLIDIYAHADHDGSSASRLALTDRQARAVGDYLASHGVARARIATRGFGDTQPVAPSGDASDRAANQRIEIKIVPMTLADLD